MAKSWPDIESEVDKNQILRVTMEDLRDAIGADRLGRNKLIDIENKLRTLDIGFFPDLATEKNHVVYLFKGEVNALVGIIKDHCDTYIRKALSEVSTAVSNSIKSASQLPWP